MLMWLFYFYQVYVKNKYNSFILLESTEVLSMEDSAYLSSTEGHTHLVYEAEHWHADVHFHFQHSRNNSPGHLLPQSQQLMRLKLPVLQGVP